MIPYSDPSEPDRIFPYVNIGLIIVNFVVFFYELSLGAQGVQAHLNDFINQYGLASCEVTGQHGTDVCPVVNHPVAVNFVTSMFIHGGWLHILGNMIYLWVFGDNVENSMGHFRYVIFYLLCGLGASALEIATSVSSTGPGIGASGAIAGVLGAYLVLYPRSRVGTLIPIAFFFIPVRLPAFVLIGFWFLLQLFNGAVVLSSHANVGGVAYWAHVGGFITGVLLIWIFRHPERVGRMRTHHAWPGFG